MSNGPGNIRITCSGFFKGYGRVLMSFK